MKQFVKAFDRNSPCFQYLCTKFSTLSHAKIREGIFDGPQIRKLMMDDSFTGTMTEIEEDAQILRETEKGDRGILTYISKECNVSKLSTHVPFTLLAKLFCLCVISLFSHA